MKNYQIFAQQGCVMPFNMVIASLNIWNLLIKEDTHFVSKWFDVFYLEKNKLGSCFEFSL